LKLKTEIELISTLAHTRTTTSVNFVNQNDDVKIFVHWACRFHFEPD